jgi:aromatic ring-cleaving dioxygenase
MAATSGAQPDIARDFADPGQIRSYHAHIYYDPETREVAERLREAIGQGFTVELGRWHDEPVGPHPISMYQVAFAVGEFPKLVPWLMLNRGGLDVLIHPQTGYSYDDHAIHALWLGTRLPLRLDAMRRRQAEAGPR